MDAWATTVAESNARAYIYGHHRDTPMNQCLHCGQPEPPPTIWQKWFWRTLGASFAVSCVAVAAITVVTLVQQITHG